MSRLSGKFVECATHYTASGLLICKAYVQSGDNIGGGLMFGDMGGHFFERIHEYLQSIGEYNPAKASLGAVLDGYVKTANRGGRDYSDFIITKITVASSDLSFILEMVRPPRDARQAA